MHIKAKLNDLISGLKLLNQADPCVEIIHQQNGELILCSPGEVIYELTKIRLILKL
jgi:translation elongation factor EF-G